MGNILLYVYTDNQTDHGNIIKSDSGQKLSTLLTCKKCFLMFNLEDRVPYILPCSHTFCDNCISKQIGCECFICKASYIRKPQKNQDFIEIFKDFLKTNRSEEKREIKALMRNEELIKILLEQYESKREQTDLMNGLFSARLNDDKGEYFGETFDGKRHGYGKNKAINGDEYKGDWKGDIKDGEGCMKYENGDQYNGGWMQDKREGYGNFKYSNGCIYEGEYKDDKMHGKGKAVRLNGYYYEGEIMYGQRHGKGKVTHNNGFFEGEFRQGKIHGKGKNTSIDNIFEGEWDNDVLVDGGKWDNDVQTDRGKLVYKNGDVYTGKVVDTDQESRKTFSGDIFDQIYIWITEHGEGKLVKANGEIYEGEWNERQFEGKGKKVYKNGDIYIGNWAFTKRQGFGKLFCKNGESYDGEWFNDMRDGEIVKTYSNGKKELQKWAEGRQIE